MSLSKELVDRLVCSKYLFHKGVETLNQGGIFSAGIAVQYFQDAAEITLRVIAEHLHCNIKENAVFNQIVDSINSKCNDNQSISHRSALNQLNKARCNFKHHGLEPKKENAIKFRGDLESFFPNAFKMFLGIDFHQVSLTKLINHRRTENFLNQAENFIESGDYEESISSSAIAFTIFKAHFSDIYYGYEKEPFRETSDPVIQNWVDSLEDEVIRHEEQLNLIMYGINLVDYNRFSRCTPSISMTGTGTYHVTHMTGRGHLPASNENALFCFNFVINAILLMRDNELPPFNPSLSRLLNERSFKVINKVEVIVFPCKSPEVIREAEVGETFFGQPPRFDRGEYIAVLLDGDTAYINNASVEEITFKKPIESDLFGI